MIRGAALALALAMTPAAVPAQIVDFAALAGWEEDDHAAALAAFRATCDLIDGPEWAPVCALARDADATAAGARAFFERLFRPVVIGEPPALFTGYYEPVLDGSLRRTPRFAWPIYRRPPELRDGVQYHSRAVIENGVLSGRGLELAWLDDPVEAYFLQVQGSGRIRLPDGGVMRVGYAGRNGHAYRSVGQEMIRRGTLGFDQVSAQAIKSWVRANPQAGAALLDTNPSYIFFRRLADLSAEAGPIGAMGRSIFARRSLAVDPGCMTLGAPVWIEKAGVEPLNRLMVAQDTGGAIRGVQRADIFYGTGAEAGEAAGIVKDSGRMVVLLPVETAFAMLAGEP